MQERLNYLKKKLKSLEIAMAMGLIVGCGVNTTEVEAPKVIDIGTNDDGPLDSEKQILTYDEVRNLVLTSGYSSNFVCVSNTSHIDNESLLKAYQLAVSIINKGNLSNKFLYDSVVTMAFLMENGYEVAYGNDYITLSLDEEDYNFRENWLLMDTLKDNKYRSLEVDTLNDSYYMSLFMDLDNENSLMLGTDNVGSTREELVFHEDYFSNDVDEDYDKYYGNITYGLTKEERDALDSSLVDIYHEPAKLTDDLTDKDIKAIVLDRKTTFFEVLNTKKEVSEVAKQLILRK